MSTATKPRVTVDEFLAMNLGEGRHELVRGEIVEMAPRPSPERGSYCGQVYWVLSDYGRRTGHGYALSNDSAVRVGDLTLRGADVCYYSSRRLPRERLGPEPADLPPDLVAEVLSPSDRTDQVMEKVADYLRAGVANVWVVDPARRTVAVYRHDTPTPRVLGPGDVLDAVPELPGFACPVAELVA